MFWSLVPLVLVCIALAAMVGTCSFQPKGPAQGVTPSYDTVLGMQADADTLKIPVRRPDLPAGWQANSGNRGSIESGRTDDRGQRVRALTTRVGYIAPSKMFVSLTQSNADETALVQSIDSEVYPAGTEDVDGVKWVVYQGGAGTEPIWTTRLDSPQGAAQLAITGAGSAEDFRELAAATQSQPPLVPAR